MEYGKLIRCDSVAQGSLHQKVGNEREMVAEAAVVNRSEVGAERFDAAVAFVGLRQEGRGKDSAACRRRVEARGRAEQLAVDDDMVELVPTSLVFIGASDVGFRPEVGRQDIELLRAWGGFWRDCLRCLAGVWVCVKHLADADVGVFVVEVAKGYEERVLPAV